MSFQSDYDTGLMATEVLKKRYAKRGYMMTSIEGTDRDIKLGEDYELKTPKHQFTGSHRHVKNALRDYFCIRYQRLNGTPTDFHKMKSKSDDYIYSFSWGSISENMEILLVYKRDFRGWLESHRTTLKTYIKQPYGPQESYFLCIPIEDVKSFKI